MNTNVKTIQEENLCQDRIILSKNIQIPIDDLEKPENANVLIVSGAGAGKLACYTEPNIMQADSSYIISDPGGIEYSHCRKFLEYMGYKVKCLNLIHMKNSNHYNPFRYIHCDKDIEVLAETLFNNTVPTNGNEDDPSFAKAEKALLIALVAYLHYYECDKEQTLSTIIRLLNVADADEKCPSVSKTLDLIFDDVEECDPDSFAVKQYKIARITAGRMWSTVVRSCLDRLTVFNNQKAAELTNTDDIGLDSMGDEKTALFIIIPTGEKTYNFLAAALYSQFFKTASDYCENAAEFTQLVMDGKGHLARCYKAGSHEESEKMAEKAKDFLERAKHGYIRKNELYDRYELITEDGEVFGYRGSKEDAESVMTAIREGGYVIQKRRKYLPLRIRVLLNSFANIGTITDFPKVISTVFRYGISVSVYVDSYVQLRRLYELEWPVITQNCGTTLYLGGGTDCVTATWLSERMAGSVTGLTKSFLGRRPKSRIREWGIMRLPHDECIVMRSGRPAYKDKKYKTVDHPNRKAELFCGETQK